MVLCSGLQTETELALKGNIFPKWFPSIKAFKKKIYEFGQACMLLRSPLFASAVLFLELIKEYLTVWHNGNITMITMMRDDNECVWVCRKRRQTKGIPYVWSSGLDLSERRRYLNWELGSSWLSRQQFKQIFHW